MEINKKSRAELKAYFVKNAIPTESNFRDLIEAALSQKDDGVAKPAGEPLSVEATTAKAALRLYEAFSDASPAWVMSLVLGDPATGKKGFALSDGSGATRLFIERASGALSVSGALHANAGLNVSGAVSITTPLGGNSGFGYGDTGDAYLTFGSKGGMIIRSVLDGGVHSQPHVYVDGNGNVRIGTAERTAPGAGLEIFKSNTNNLGLLLKSSGPGWGSGLQLKNTAAGGKTWGIYSDGTGEGSLHFADADTGVDRLLITRTGVDVKGGSLNATAGLAVTGNATVSGGLTANGGVASSGALTVAGNATVNGAATFAGALTATKGLTASGPIAANAGLTVTSLTASASIAANAGVSVPNGQSVACGKFRWNERGSLCLTTASGDIFTVNERGNVMIQTASGGDVNALSLPGQMKIFSTIEQQKTGIVLNHYYYYNSASYGFRDAAFLGMVDENHLAIEGYTNYAGNHGVKFKFGTDDGELWIAGNGLKPGGGAWGSTSDERLKQNVSPLEGALERLLLLRGVNFEWREPLKHGNQSGLQTGMIAQEVEQVFPEWVGVDRDGFKTLSIRGFEALTVEALRELKAEIQKLRGEAADVTPRARQPRAAGRMGTPPPPERPGRSVVGREIAATYDYTDEAGKLLFQVVRYLPKAFRCRRPDGRGGWISDLKGVRLELYRLPEVIRATSTCILEGEEDVAAALALGFPDQTWAATTAAGPLQWRTEYAERLRGKDVVVCPDTDQAGQLYLARIVRDLDGKVASLRCLRLAPEFKDFRDWVKAGGTREQFAVMLRDAQPIDAQHLPPV